MDVGMKDVTSGFRVGSLIDPAAGRAARARHHGYDLGCLRLDDDLIGPDNDSLNELAEIGPSDSAVGVR